MLPDKFIKNRLQLIETAKYMLKNPKESIKYYGARNIGYANLLANNQIKNITQYLSKRGIKTMEDTTHGSKRL